MKRKFTNKEISWLSFNARVLQEAEDQNLPIIERLKFLGIYSSNLDEFFRIRVATLKRLKKLGKSAIKIIGHHPAKILKKIESIVLEQNKKFDKIYGQLLKELAQNNIFLINEKQLTADQAIFVRSYFQQHVRPQLIPVMIDQIEDFPALRDRSIYLAVSLSAGQSPDKKKYTLIEIPTDVLPRFLILPQLENKKYLILLDDVIRLGLEDIFSVFGFDSFEAYTIKLTRDAELDIDDDLSQSYVEKVHKSLKKRKAGNPVRFIYDINIPPLFLEYITKRLKLLKGDTLIPGSRYHNFKDFMDFPDMGIKALLHKPLNPHNHPTLVKNESLLQVIREKDIIFHYPYQSFHYIIDLLREASIDPGVKSIKVTLYRVAKHSSVINALINAAKNGKAVVVVLELQARFDEEANLSWADRLREEGVRVIYGVPGLKVHAKVCLITRKEQGKVFLYGILGTGNLNEDTAKVYTDHSLFTSDKRITKEIYRIFDFFETNYNVVKFKHLLVSPFNFRKKLNNLIKNEIKNVENGQQAYIWLKLNNLVDRDIINRLYKASQAGVKIRIIARGMFSLIPGIEGMSENIEAISIIDRFLEHSRIFIFCNEGEEKYYISSADLMPRNLDRRIEVVCPIYDHSIQQELKQYFICQWQDNVKARVYDEQLSNRFRQNKHNKTVRAQMEIYKILKS